jgi:hypothetical protein
MKKLFTLAVVCLLFAQNALAQCTAEILQTGPLATCTGDVFTLNATPGGTAYQWTVNGVNIPGATSDNYDVPTTTTNTLTYTVEITFNTCTDVSDPVTVTVNQTPPTPIATANSPVCQGQLLVLTANTLPGVSYQWIGPGLMMSPLQTWTLIAQPFTAGVFTLNVIATNGCVSDTAYINVQVNPTPSITSFTSNSPVCSGDTIEFGITSSMMSTYSVTGPTGYTSTSSTPIRLNAQLTDAGEYYVVSSWGGCTSAPDTVVVSINQSPLPPSVISPTTFCQFETAQLQATGVNMLWYTVQVGGTGVPTMTANTTSPGTLSYWVSQTVNGCESERAELAYNVVVCDDVWPGDVNWDLTANNDDILDIGLAYGQTGTPRTGASLNWVAQTCTDWGTNQVNGADMKHADCNGDGIVDATDEDAVTLNYGMIHPKGVHLPQAKSAALPDLYFDLTGINFVEGTTVSIPIKLGTGTLPMNNILGIAAKIKVQNVTLVNAPTVNNTTSWIGNGTNTMNFYKGVNPNQTDWALVRTDHNNVSGDGTIATLVMDIPVGSSGDAILYFEGVKIINTAGDVLTDYNVIDDTASIIPVAIHNTENTSNKIVIVPNPSESNADLQLTLSQATNLQISITDISGRQVWKKDITTGKGNSSITLPATQLASGIYTIKIKGIDTPAIKWIKK